MIDGLMLALSHSKLQHMASSKQLSTILNIEYAEIVESGAVDLQVLWDLLAEEPGFDSEDAEAPMCTLKGWTEHFGMDVVLPEHLRNLSDREIALKTTDCAVPSQEVRRTFSVSPKRAAARASLGAEFVTDGVSAGVLARKATWRDRREVGWIVSAVAVLTFVFVAITFFKECSTTDWEGFDATEFAAGIPVKSAQQFGAQVGAVVEDPGWFKRPAQERRDQMETALRGLEARKVEVFFVRDRSGRVRATAQWFDNRSRIRVRFQ
jgi:hypothetical protein